MFRSGKRTKLAAARPAAKRAKQDGQPGGDAAAPLLPWSGLERVWAPPTASPPLPVGAADLFNRFAVYRFRYHPEWRSKVPWDVDGRGSPRAAVVLLCEVGGGFQAALLTARAAAACGPTPLSAVEPFLARLYGSAASEVVVGGAILPAVSDQVPPLSVAGLSPATVGAPWGWLSAAAAGGATRLAVRWAQPPPSGGPQLFVLSGGGPRAAETAVGAIEAGGIVLGAGTAAARRVGARVAPMRGGVAAADTLSARQPFFEDGDVATADEAAANSTELRLDSGGGGLLVRGSMVRIVHGSMVPEVLVLVSRPALVLDGTFSRWTVGLAAPTRQAWPAGAKLRPPCMPPALQPSVREWEMLTALAGFEWRPASAVRWPAGVEFSLAALPAAASCVVTPVAAVLSAGSPALPLAERIRLARDPAVRPPFNSRTIRKLLSGGRGPRSWVSRSLRGTPLLVVDLRARGDAGYLARALWKERAGDNRQRALQSAALQPHEREALASASEAPAGLSGPVDVEALPPCVRAVLPGGAMRAAAESSSGKAHMNNKERHVVAQVFQRLCIDIEDAHVLVGATLEKQSRGHFNSHLKRPYEVAGCSRLCSDTNFPLCNLAVAEKCAAERGDMRGRITPVSVALALQRARSSSPRDTALKQ